MSIEWMVALAVFAGVGVLWYFQRASVPYRRSREAASGSGGTGRWSFGDSPDGDGGGGDGGGD